MLHKVLARRRTRRIVAGLSVTQLRDTGIDPLDCAGRQPVFEATPFLESYLMSLR